jgi:hypothetical protein
MNPQIEGARQSARMAQQRFLKTLGAVPDDKLTWSPAPSGKTALRIAAHCAVACGMFSAILRGQPIPGSSMEELEELTAVEEIKLTTRDAAIAALNAGCDEVDAVLAGLPEDRLGAVVKLPFMEAPMSFLMALPSIHLIGHAGQIDYLQTLWGDMDPHFA